MLNESSEIMIINYSNQEIMKGDKAIFLAGPTIRDRVITEWRVEALKIFAELKFDGIVYIPEYLDMEINDEYVRQVMWERNALAAATVILFWVPREIKLLPGFTTNVEFGYWIHSGKVIYGRPDDAEKIKYLDWLYEFECNEKPFNNLRKLIESAILRCDNGK